MSMRSVSKSSSSVSNGRQEGASVEVEGDDGSRIYFCRKKARMSTSRIEGNPGRRFFGCPRYSSGQRHLACKYFEWLDPAPVAHGEDDLEGMGKKLNMIQDQLKILQDQLKISEDRVKILEEQLQLLREWLLKQKARRGD